MCKRRERSIHRTLAGTHRDAITGSVHSPYGHAGPAETAFIHVRGDLTRKAQRAESPAETWAQGDMHEVVTGLRLSSCSSLLGREGLLALALYFSDPQICLLLKWKIIRAPGPLLKTRNQSQHYRNRNSEQKTSWEKVPRHSDSKENFFFVFFCFCFFVYLFWGQNPVMLKFL